MPAQGPESSEARLLPILHQGQGTAVLGERRHPGGVVQASDVRADEGGNHATSRYGDS